MKRRAGKYFLSLLFTGIVIFLITDGVIALILVPLYDASIYDFGVSSLFVGIIIAIASFLVLFSLSSWHRRLENYLPTEMRGQGVRDHFRDILWTVMITGMFLAFSGYSLVNISLQQGIRSPNPDTRPSVGSLRSELNLHEEYAKRYWAEDASLHEATLWIGDNPRWRVQSIYYSVLNPKERLYLFTEPDGSISTNLYENRDSRASEYSIHEEDWQLDSQDAIDIFLENPEVRKCVMSNLNPVYEYYSNVKLSLQRSTGIKNYSVFWALSLPKSCDVENYYLSMDAQTGKVTSKRP